MFLQTLHQTQKKTREIKSMLLPEKSINNKEVNKEYGDRTIVVLIKVLQMLLHSDDDGGGAGDRCSQCCCCCR